MMSDVAKTRRLGAAGNKYTTGTTVYSNNGGLWPYYSAGKVMRIDANGQVGVEWEDGLACTVSESKLVKFTFTLTYFCVSMPNCVLKLKLSTDIRDF